MVLSGLRSAISDAITNEIPKHGGAVFDFGCGDRPYETFFRNAGWKYTGGDIQDSAEIQINPEKIIPLPDQSFEGLLSFQVLEHIWNLDWYFTECRRLLKADGWLLLSTHGHWPYHPVPHDFRRWTREGLFRELESRGFKIIKFWPIVGPLALATQYRLLGLREVFKSIPLIQFTLLKAIILFSNLRMLFEEKITPRSFLEENSSHYLIYAKIVS